MDQSEFVRVIEDWQDRIEPFQEEMGKKASKLQSTHYLLGVPSIALSTTASGTMLVSPGDTPLLPDTVVGLISLVAAILAGVITFVSHAKRAEQHRSSAAQLTSIRRSLDIEKAFPPSSAEEMKTKLIELNNVISDVAMKAPTIQFSRGDSGDSGSGGASVIMPTVR